MAGSMANAAVPKREMEKNAGRPMTVKELDASVADAMSHENRTMETIRGLEVDTITKLGAAEANAKMSSIAEIQKNQGKIKKHNQVCKVGDTDVQRVHWQPIQLD